MSKRKILIHSIVFSPDSVSTAYLYNDIALKFLESNYEVIILTTTPHYNVVPEELVKQPLKSRCWGLYYTSCFHGIPVLHVPQKKFKNTFLRILGFFYWHLLSMILAIMQKNISLILSPSPPITIGVINIIIAKIKKAKVIYNVQEIYPDFLINQGDLKFKPAIKMLKAIEHFVYNYSSATTTINNVFYDNIVSRFKNFSKLHIIPNFVDIELFKPIASSKINPNPIIFPKKAGVLKVMYAGNIGHAQDWKPLIEIARQLQGHPIEFWIIGEGVMKDLLDSRIKENNLKNVHLVSYLPRDQMPTLVAYADIHFIFMTKKMEKQGFPSKIYTIMACAKPMLIASGYNSPLTKFLKPVNCAFIATSNDFEEKCNELIDFCKKAIYEPDTLIKMGYNGYSLIESQYSKNNVTTQYVKLADEIFKPN